MFEPARCPHVDCPRHRRPTPGFYTHHGSYQPKCRPHPVPRTAEAEYEMQNLQADSRDEVGK